MDSLLYLTPSLSATYKSLITRRISTLEAILAKRGDGHSSLTVVARLHNNHHKRAPKSLDVGYCRFGMPTVWVAEGWMPLQSSEALVNAVADAVKQADAVTALRAAKV